MSTLRKIKILATRCVLSPSPTGSPRASPMVQLRRRKTNLRPRRRRNLPVQQKPLLDSSQKKDKDKDLARKNSLKELFVSLPAEEDDVVEENSEKVSVGDIAIGGSGTWRGGSGLHRPVWNAFRCRSLLRRAWRPVLDTITE